MTAPARLTDEERATIAFEVHAALLRTEALNPNLKNNPLWLILRQDSFEEFYVAMDKIA